MCCSHALIISNAFYSLIDTIRHQEHQVQHLLAILIALEQMPEMCFCMLQATLSEGLEVIARGLDMPQSSTKDLVCVKFAHLGITIQPPAHTGSKRRRQVKTQTEICSSQFIDKLFDKDFPDSSYYLNFDKFSSELVCALIYTDEYDEPGTNVIHDCGALADLFQVPIVNEYGGLQAGDGQARVASIEYSLLQHLAIPHKVKEQVSKPIAT